MISSFMLFHIKTTAENRKYKHRANSSCCDRQSTATGARQIVWRMGPAIYEPAKWTEGRTGVSLCRGAGGSFFNYLAVSSLFLQIEQGLPQVKRKANPASGTGTIPCRIKNGEGDKISMEGHHLQSQQRLHGKECT